MLLKCLAANVARDQIFRGGHHVYGSFVALRFEHERSTQPAYDARLRRAFASDGVSRLVRYLRPDWRRRYADYALDSDARRGRRQPASYYLRRVADAFPHSRVRVV